MKNKYYDNITLLQNINTSINTLEETNKDMIYKNYNDIEYKENKKKIEELQTIQEITLNNFLHIQQELLQELLEIFKSKYIDKRIGEKTKEKIQNDFNTYILGNYNIECYCYINTKTNYNYEEEIKICCYFKDLYYQYDLKQEEIRYNKNKEESYLYYYSKIDYTNVEEIEEKAKELRNNYNNNIEKIKELKKEIEKTREENNKNNKCCLKSTYIDYRDC